ncbi:MAG: hypothetical protein FJ271_07180 [Planctomycetes bacterium]|nr:hypothetical protein [Planctomycetota bacterium]
MRSNRWLTTVLIGAFTVIVGCKKTEAVPIVDATPSLGQEEKKQAQPVSNKPAVVNPVVVKAAPATKPPPVDIQVARAQGKEEPAAKASAPADKGAKLLDELLRPSDAAATRLSQGPKQLARPASIEKPAPPLPQFRGLPARFAAKPAGKTTPRDPSEGTPLASIRETPKGPEEILFAVQALERWPSPDSGEPVPLPIMAQYVPDRASLVGPSGESSRDAALAGAMPARTAPLPFIRFNLPDPFENRMPIRTTAMNNEKADPVVSTPRPLIK